MKNIYNGIMASITELDAFAKAELVNYSPDPKDDIPKYININTEFSWSKESSYYSEFLKFQAHYGSPVRQ